MYAMLGLILIDSVANGFTDTDQTHSVTFAEHAVFKGKPQLQKIAPNLETFNFSMSLSYKGGGVNGRIERLKTMLNKQNPVSLIMGNGRFLGMFVLNDINVTTTIADDRGGLMGADLSISLTEFAGELESDSTLSGIANKALGAVGAATTTFNEISNTVNSAIDGVTAAIDGAKGIIDYAVDIGNTVTQLASATDPIEMLKGISGAVSGSLGLAQNILNIDLPNGGAFDGFLGNVSKGFDALNLLKDVGGEAIASNILGDYLPSLEAANRNLQSASNLLTKDIPTIACEIGKRLV